jgi:hypothetical protein
MQCSHAARIRNPKPQPSFAKPKHALGCACILIACIFCPPYFSAQTHTCVWNRSGVGLLQSGKSDVVQLEEEEEEEEGCYIEWRDEPFRPMSPIQEEGSGGVGGFGSDPDSSSGKGEEGEEEGRGLHEAQDLYPYGDLDTREAAGSVKQGGEVAKEVGVTRSSVKKRSLQLERRGSALAISLNQINVSPPDGSRIPTSTTTTTTTSSQHAASTPPVAAPGSVRSRGLGQVPTPKGPQQQQGPLSVAAGGVGGGGRATPRSVSREGIALMSLRGAVVPFASRLHQTHVTCVTLLASRLYPPPSLSVFCLSPSRHATVHEVPS